MVQPQWGTQRRKSPLCTFLLLLIMVQPTTYTRHGSEVEQQYRDDTAVYTQDGSFGSSSSCFCAVLQTPDVFLFPWEEGNHQQLFQAQGDRDLFLGASP